MNNKFIKYFAVAAALTSIFALTGCGAKTNTAKDTNTIVVGLDDSFPPMGFKNDKNELQGFDIDMAKEIGKRTGKTFEFMPFNWDGIVPGLQQKKFDVIISAMSVTPEREKEINFSTPYLNERQVVVVKKDNSTIASPSDLKGKVVGVQRGSTSETAMASVKNDIKEVKYYNENMDALTDLSFGRIDAVVVDELVARYYIKEHSDVYKVLDKELSTEPIAVGIRKDDTANKELFDKAIKDMKADGTLAKISEKWFGENITDK